MGVIEDKLKLLPTNPGVYVMLDEGGNIIYVGKAKNLKNRVRQYFFNSVKTEKVMAMVKNVADFYYIITKTEIDALSLENNLIKKHKPRYNILLKDDKTYPYIKINIKEEYPSFTVTRKIKKDGAKYFGPFMGGVSVNDVLEIINLAFNIRPCDKKLNTVKPQKPCLNYHIKKCFAPCAKYITKEEYAEKVALAIDFLNGDIDYAKKLLQEKMAFASQSEEFEQALKYRDILNSLNKVGLKRLTSLNKFVNADVIAFKSNEIYSAVCVLVVRSGKMLGAKHYSFSSAALDDASALREFITQYYRENTDSPDEIITDTVFSDIDALEKYLSTVLNKNIKIINAILGVRKQLLDMAEVNALEHLETAVDRIKHKLDMTVLSCERLKEVLNLKSYPKRMECYDISNISGTDKVGSMVVFNDGEPDRDSYRRFKIKTVVGADDFKSLQEVLLRRLNKLNSDDADKFPKPNLIIIDGGKGQLSSVKEVFDDLGVTDIDLISLAKREEEIFTVNSLEPVVLEKRDYSLKMLQRIRDEAHRFAITYHRSLRSKRALSSVLDGIDGIGKEKKRALLEHFKDLSGIIKATKEELEEVEGIGEKRAVAIIDYLTKEGLK